MAQTVKGKYLSYPADGWEEIVLAVYVDRRGWTYKVMPDLAGKYAPRYHKPESAPEVGWKTCKAFTHRDNLEEAERDLKAWAMKKGMTAVVEEQ